MKNKLFGTAIASALLGLFAGCVTTAARLDRVEDGMARERVLSLLGTPDGMRTRDNVEYLTYYLTSGSTIGEHPYMVRLVNGRVDTVGRFVQLGSPANKGNGSASVGMGAILSPEAFPSATAQLQQLAAKRDRGEISEAEFIKTRNALLASDR